MVLLVLREKLALVACEAATAAAVQTECGK
jgi:hypothetical protein